MRIAVIGWGALMFERWRVGDGVEWQRGGPELPIGICNAPRAFLAFDPIRGQRRPTHFAVTHQANLETAIQDFADREDPTGRSVGYVAGGRENASERLGGFADYLLSELRDWCEHHDVDAVIWRWQNPPAVSFH